MTNRKIHLWEPGTGQVWLTSGGRVLTDADIQVLADEAEAGYDIEMLKERRPRVCPQCGHPVTDHNDAGSEPIMPLDEMPAHIPAGQMCCYARVDEAGIENWAGRVCGCEYAPRGSKRYY